MNEGGGGGERESLHGTHSLHWEGEWEGEGGGGHLKLFSLSVHFKKKKRPQTDKILLLKVDPFQTFLGRF